MSELENKIVKILKEILSSADLRALTACSGESYVLTLKSIKCVRKNEISHDEIKLHLFWVSQDGSISRMFDAAYLFKEEGDKQEICTDMELNYSAQNNILCLVIYEEDTPALLDQHDLIGVVAFFPRLQVIAFGGNNIKQSKPVRQNLKPNKLKEITLDAISKGRYRVDVVIGDSGSG